MASIKTNHLVKTIALMFFVFGILLAPPMAHAEETWPLKSIRLVVGFPPGGSSDVMGRLVASHLSKEIGVNIFVENKPGATTQIATELVSKAAPDGYTLLSAASSSFTTLPHIRKLQYELDSFEFIGGVANYIAVLAVKKDLPVNNIQEFIAYAKANPGKLAFGSAGEASAGHVYGGILARDTGINVLHVPFRGSAAAVNALLAGDVDFVIDGAVSQMLGSDTARAKPLASLYRRRHPGLPDVPTAAEAGFPIEMAKGVSFGVLAPKGLPENVAKKLSQALEKVVSSQKFQDEIGRANSVALWQSPEEYKRGILIDQKMYGELLPKIGVKAN